MYRYLFYSSYKIAERSKKFEDAPVVGGVWFIMLGFLFNVYTIYFFLDSFWDFTAKRDGILGQLKYPLSFISVALFYLYFRIKWKKIVSKYDGKTIAKSKPFFSIIIILCYNVASVVLLFLAAMYRNGDWIFA